MTESLEVFRSLQYDCRIYATLRSDFEVKKIEYFLYKEQELLESKISFDADETVIFAVKESGRLRVKAIIHGGKNNNIRQLDKYIDVPSVTVKYTALKTDYGIKKVTNAHTLVLGVEGYSLEVKLSAGGYEKLQEDAQHSLPLFKAFSLRHQQDAAIVGEVLLPVFSAGIRKKSTSGLLDNLYYTPFYVGFDELKAVAAELEQLSYVEYCAVVPEHSGEPEESLFDEAQVADRLSATAAADFTAKQTYLQAFPGMNVQRAWQKGGTGTGATVHVLDSGIYQNHEDLVGNFTLVTNRAETAVRNHGTACAGIIAAKANGFGVTGIAHTCKLYSYEASTKSLDLLIQKARPGDIVSLSQGFTTSTGKLPLISSQAWWLRLKALTELGATVFCSASNGGLDISPAAGKLIDYGDSGVILVGASDPVTSRIRSTSNYNHYALVANAWGSKVVTTGYGTLAGKGDVNASYASDFNGTSAACPIVAGCMALVQAYAKERYGVFLNAHEIRDLIVRTGRETAPADRIGYKPDTLAAMEYVDSLFVDPEPQPEPEPKPEPQPSRYPQWQRDTAYVGGSRVSHLGHDYLAKWWIGPDTEPGLDSTTGKMDGDGRPWTRT